MHVNLTWYFYPFIFNKICLSLSLNTNFIYSFRVIKINFNEIMRKIWRFSFKQMAFTSCQLPCYFWYPLIQRQTFQDRFTSRCLHQSIFTQYCEYVFKEIVMWNSVSWYLYKYASCIFAIFVFGYMTHASNCVYNATTAFKNNYLLSMHSSKRI